MKNIRPSFWIVLIALFGALLYINTYDFGYTLDDGIYSYDNRVTVLGLSNWTELFKYGSMNFYPVDPTNSSIYRPFTLLTFAIENQIFGEFNPRNGHILNIALYGILLVIIGFFLVDLLSRRQIPVWIPFLILLIYAVHPLHTEVVASVKSRDILLSSIFAWTAILIWLKDNGAPRIWRSILVGFLFFFSLISKEETIPLLALIVMISYFFQKKELIGSIKSIVPFFIPFIIYMGIRSIILDPPNLIYISIINSVLYGATSGEMLATNFFIYIQYIKLLFFPHSLSWDYSFSQISVQTFSNPIVWFSLMFFASLIYISIRGFKDKNLFSFGILFYLSSFSIFANLTSSLIIGSNLGERFMFIPSLAFSFLVVYGLFWLSQNYSIKKPALLVGSILLPVILAFSWKTVDRSKVWENNSILYESGVDSSPKSWRTHMFYGIELRNSAKKIKNSSLDSARMYFELSIKEMERGFEIINNKSKISVYKNLLADSYLSLGDSTKAISILNKSIEDTPNASLSFLKLGEIALNQNDVNKAEELYLKGLKAPSPNHFVLYNALGILYDQENENLKAISALRKALEYREDRSIRKALGFLYFQEGDEKTAKSYFGDDDEIDMEEVRFIKDMKLANLAFKKEEYQKSVKGFSSLVDRLEKYGGEAKYPQFFGAYGESLIETGDTIQAKRYLMIAYELNPFQPVICTNLGVIAFFFDKDYEVAARYFEESIQSGVSDLHSAYVNLGSAQLQSKKELAAVESFERALEIRATRSLVGNLYLLNKNLGNKEKEQYYLNMLQSSSTSR